MDRSTGSDHTTMGLWERSIVLGAAVWCRLLAAAAAGVSTSGLTIGGAA